MTKIMTALANELAARGAIDVREAYIDACFAPAKKGALKVGKTKRGKGTQIMAVADRHGLPVSVCIESATPHEVTLATSTASDGCSRRAAELDRRQRLRVGPSRRRVKVLRH